MKSKIILLAFTFFLFSNIYSQTEWYQANTLNYPTVNNPLNKPGYILVFNDEFNSSPFDDNKWERWNYNLGGELQCYVDNVNHIPHNPNYVFTTDEGNSVLQLIARQEIPPSSMTDNWKYKYTSAGFQSKKSFKYGYFEMRCKLPPGETLWPAFWLFTSLSSIKQPAQFYYQGNEIDIFEIFGNKLDVDGTNYHWVSSNSNSLCNNCDANWGYTCGNQRDIKIDISGPYLDFSKKYYTFGLEWNPNRLDFYINNILVRTIKHENIPDCFMRIIANLAIAGEWAGRPNNSSFPAIMNIDYIRVYKKNWSPNFCTDQGWSSSKHPRFLADINGDGKDDIIGFGDSKVNFAIAYEDNNGSGFRWFETSPFNDFCSAQGWTISKNPIFMADVNGDGKKDIVGFSDAGVKVALAYVDEYGPGFRWPTSWLDGYFGYNADAGSWNTTKKRRYLADVNGDGKDDIVGFNSDAVYVSLSDGSLFTKPKIWCTDFCYAQGWTISKNPIFMADVNGDGKKDIVGFSDAGVKVALAYVDANGPGFRWPTSWLDGYFGYNANAGSWNTTTKRRYLADVNGDGKDDIVGFNSDTVYVSLSKSLCSSFSEPKKWCTDFSSTQGWNNPSLDEYPIYLSDINGDGKKDIVGFSGAGVLISLAYNDDYVLGFRYPELWYNDFGYDDGYRFINNPRMVGDVNGDGKADIVCFRKEGVFVTLAPNCSNSITLF